MTRDWCPVHGWSGGDEPRAAGRPRLELAAAMVAEMLPPLSTVDVMISAYEADVEADVEFITAGATDW